jgi:predicted nucleic acid-binding protein
VTHYLLDTNIWAYWFNKEKHPKYAANIEARVKELTISAETGARDCDRIAISVITWGEIDYGYNVMTSKERSREAPFRSFIAAQSSWMVPFDKYTAAAYGKLRAKLFEKFGPKEWKRKGLRPSQVTHPVPPCDLGIDENDLWIVAQAIRYGLTLVTNDKMASIKTVTGTTLRIENWAQSR